MSMEPYLSCSAVMIYLLGGIRGWKIKGGMERLVPPNRFCRCLVGGLRRKADPSAKYEYSMTLGTDYRPPLVSSLLLIRRGGQNKVSQNKFLPGRNPWFWTLSWLGSIILMIVFFALNPPLLLPTELKRCCVFFYWEEYLHAVKINREIFQSESSISKKRFP